MFFFPLENTQMEEFSADFSVIPNHFHDKLQKLGENSSVCVKNIFFLMIIDSDTNVLYVI